MIKWAGRLIAFYGAAHTILALTLEKAARHAGAWFSGELWDADFVNMSPAMSAYWFSVGSFGVPLFLVGLMVLWLDRRGITPLWIIRSRPPSSSSAAPFFSSRGLPRWQRTPSTPWPRYDHHRPYPSPVSDIYQSY